MATKVITRSFYVGATGAEVLTDMTSVKLSDPTAAYGVRRVGGAVLVPDATPMVWVATGVYQYTVAAVVADVEYEYVVEFVYGGETFWDDPDVFTCPSAGPVTVAEAKTFLRVDTAADDDLIERLLEAATAWAETFTGRKFLTAACTRKGDAFDAAVIHLPWAPLVAVAAITYVDCAGTVQPLADTEYLVDTQAEPGRITPAWGKTWPVPRSQPNAVVITYTAGYGTADQVPSAIKSAILFIVAAWYADREAGDVPMGAKNLLGPYRVFGAYWGNDG